MMIPHSDPLPAYGKRPSVSRSLSRGAGEGKGEGTSRARKLRRTQTDAERKLWSLLRNRQLLGSKFRRQHPIGPFFADFCCPERRLVVELDGGQHVAMADADRRRTVLLETRGYRVLRFWDHELLQQPESVLEVIGIALRTPHPHPLPADGEREQEQT